jgi:hypothetical protein
MEAKNTIGRKVKKVQGVEEYADAVVTLFNLV